MKKNCETKIERPPEPIFTFERTFSCGPVFYSISNFLPVTLPFQVQQQHMLIKCGLHIPPGCEEHLSLKSRSKQKMKKLSVFESFLPDVCERCISGMRQKIILLYSILEDMINRIFCHFSSFLFHHEIEDQNGIPSSNAHKNIRLCTTYDENSISIPFLASCIIVRLRLNVKLFISRDSFS